MSKQADGPDVIIYGGPGSGKSTQAHLLAAFLSAYHLNAGALLRAFAHSNSQEAKAVAKAMAKGALVPARISTNLVTKFVSHAGKRRLVIEGYPRSMSQVYALDKILSSHHRSSAFVYIKLPVTVARARLLKRAKLEHRADDTPKAIAERIRVFHQQSKDILAHYRKTDRLITIDGNHTVTATKKLVERAIKDQSWTNKI